MGLELVGQSESPWKPNKITKSKLWLVVNPYIIQTCLLQNGSEMKNGWNHQSCLVNRYLADICTCILVITCHLTSFTKSSFIFGMCCYMSHGVYFVKTYQFTSDLPPEQKFEGNKKVEVCVCLYDF